MADPLGENSRIIIILSCLTSLDSSKCIQKRISQSRAPSCTTRVPSCTTPQSRAPLTSFLNTVVALPAAWPLELLLVYHRAPLRNLVNHSCTIVHHSAISCIPHKLLQLSWHFPLPGRRIPLSRSFLNSRAPLKYSLILLKYSLSNC